MSRPNPLLHRRAPSAECRVGALVLALILPARAGAQGGPADTARLGRQPPAAPASLARERGWMPLASTGVPAFRSAHPTWDGRGVLIAILDTGVDPGVAGLGSTAGGSTRFPAAIPPSRTLPSGFRPLLLFVLESEGSAWTWQLPVP